jgi:outer membrane protein OmpA-like peptidoglycan-associated protein
MRTVNGRSLVLRLTTIAVLAAPWACATVPHLTGRLAPVRDRVTDEAIAADVAVFDGWQRRSEVLSSSSRGAANAAAVGAAQSWIAFARDAYDRNDRSARPDSALARAARLIESVESGRTPDALLVAGDLTGLPEQHQALATAMTTFSRDEASGRIPEFGAARVLLARAANPILRGPVCTGEDPAAHAAALLATARERADAGRRQSLAEQARQRPTPIPTPTPNERVPVSPQEPPSMPRRGCVVDELPATVHFALDRHLLSPESRSVLDLLAQKLTERADIALTLFGHTDPRATEVYNEGLSRRRAESVRDYLIAKGISASRLETQALGENSPAVSGTTPRDHALNRRVGMQYRSASGCDLRVVEQLRDLQLEQGRTVRREKDEE